MNIEGQRVLTPKHDGTCSLSFAIAEIANEENEIGHRITVKVTKEELKAALVYILALSEELKGTGCFIKYGPKFKFIAALVDHTIVDGESSDYHGSFPLTQLMTNPYVYRQISVSEFDLVAVMNDDYLNGLPYDLGNIIREIETDRKNLVKQALFELKLSGLSIKSFNDVSKESGFLDIIKSQIKGSVK